MFKRHLRIDAYRVGVEREASDVARVVKSVWDFRGERWQSTTFYLWADLIDHIDETRAHYRAKGYTTELGDIVTKPE